MIKLRIPGPLRDLRERVTNSEAYARLRYLRYDPPEIRAAPGLAVLLVAACVGAGAGYLAYLKGRSDANAWWRAKLAQSSAAVTAVVKDERVKIQDLDGVIVKTLGETDARLTKTERELARRRLAEPLADACARCTVPRDRLGAGRLQ